MPTPTVRCECADALNFGEPAPDCSACGGSGRRPETRRPDGPIFQFKEPSARHRELAAQILYPDGWEPKSAVAQWVQSGKFDPQYVHDGLSDKLDHGARLLAEDQ